MEEKEGEKIRERERREGAGGRERRKFKFFEWDGIRRPACKNRVIFACGPVK